MIDPEDFSREFETAYGRRPRIFRAPGRVNLIGEHTDYNDGFVMPMAIDRSTWVAAAPRSDRTIVARSRELGDAPAINLDEVGLPTEARSRSTPSEGWSRYVRGVAATLDRGGRGADLLIATDVPIGAGLSSSAALEVACGYALLRVNSDREEGVDLTALALACQRAEHEFAGTRCGVMDQIIACRARAGTVLELDTRSLDSQWLPLPGQVSVLVCNTNVAHELATAEYNARRADCEAAVAILAKRFPAVRALRDATLEQVDAAGGMPERLRQRCRHVISENARVKEFARLMTSGNSCNFGAIGQLMADSHASLRDDYEVSCAELDAMVEIVTALDDVYGARMTGGGFGGCVVALVDAEADRQSLQREIDERYRTRTGLRPDVWFCAAGGGVAEWT